MRVEVLVFAAVLFGWIFSTDKFLGDHHWLKLIVTAAISIWGFSLFRRGSFHPRTEGRLPSPPVSSLIRVSDFVVFAGAIGLMVMAFPSKAAAIPLPMALFILGFCFGLRGYKQGFSMSNCMRVLLKAVLVPAGILLVIAGPYGIGLGLLVAVMAFLFGCSGVITGYFAAKIRERNGISNPGRDIRAERSGALAAWRE